MWSTDKVERRKQCQPSICLIFSMLLDVMEKDYYSVQDILQERDGYFSNVFHSIHRQSIK